MKRRIVLTAALVVLALVPTGMTQAQETAQQRAVRERIQRERERNQAIINRQKASARQSHVGVWQRYGPIEIKRSGWIRKPEQVWLTEVQVRTGWKLYPFMFQGPDYDPTGHGVGANKYFQRLEAPPPGTWIAVNCRKLMLASEAFGHWEAWMRPASGSPFDQLIVDRCSTDAATAPPVP